MSTTTGTWTREALAAAPKTYFDAVDAMDVDGVLAHFADDATLTVQTDHATFEGAAEIRRMFTDFFAASNSIFHEIRNIVVEEAAGKVATEQGYIGELTDGTK
ncbi:MAG: nuclear transport factor 2 family protein, partial [Thermoleophilia bacterium]|nr:nuclear transport factor 2 family protein [Thermoleophilia bacterium]